MRSHVQSFRAAPLPLSGPSVVVLRVLRALRGHAVRRYRFSCVSCVSCLSWFLVIRSQGRVWVSHYDTPISIRVSFSAPQTARFFPCSSPPRPRRHSLTYRARRHDETNRLGHSDVPRFQAVSPEILSWLSAPDEFMPSLITASASCTSVLIALAATSFTCFIKCKAGAGRDMRHVVGEQNGTRFQWASMR